MKYYKNLIKRKEYLVLIVSLIIFMIGTFIFYYSFVSLITENIKSSGLSIYIIYSNGIAGIIGSTNIGMSLLSIFIMYIGIIIPIITPYSQDEADYNIKIEGEYIHIIFKKNEFLLKREDFQLINLIFRKDMNGHFVSFTRGSQIYNYINFNRLAEKSISNSCNISKFEVVNKFSNVRKMSYEEKINFINKQKLKNKSKVIFILFSIILWISFIFWSFISLVWIIEYETSYIILSLIFAIISFILGKKSNKAINKDKNIIKRILSEDMYVVQCKIYDKKYEQTEDSQGTIYNNYYVKITDGNYVVNEWLPVSKARYENLDNKIIECYVLIKMVAIIF